MNIDMFNMADLREFSDLRADIGTGNTSRL